jgi:peptidoglycan-associated lipoprotein
MTSRRLALPTLIAVAAVLAACSSPVKLDEPKPTTPAPVTQAGTATPAPDAAQSQATPQSRVATVDLERQRAEAEAAARAAAALANLPRVLYFDFDSFLLRAEDKPVLEGYAKALVAQRDRKLALEGHADERGGREYNLALGQKRAEAVARAMELLGVQPGQLEAVSFGEERPANPGHDEAAWAKNRRVELKDR